MNYIYEIDLFLRVTPNQIVHFSLESSVAASSQQENNPTQYSTTQYKALLGFPEAARQCDYIVPIPNLVHFSLT